MSNNFCSRVSIPFEVKHPYLEPPSQGRLNTILNYQIVDERLLELIDSRDAYPIHTEYFIFPPGGKIVIHTDDSSVSDLCKLNMFLGTGLLRWFDPLPEFKNKPISYSAIGTPHLQFAESEVSLLHEEQMFGDYIFNPAIPHNFFNNSCEVVWIVSILLFDKKTDSFLHYNEAVQRFNT